MYSDDITERVKHEMKNQEGIFIPSFLARLDESLVQPVISLIVKGISGRGIRKA